MYKTCITTCKLRYGTVRYCPEYGNCTATLPIRCVSYSYFEMALYRTVLGCGQLVTAFDIYRIGGWYVKDVDTGRHDECIFGI